LTGPFRAGAVAQPMRLIVVQAPDLAGRAGGAAYLCAAPSAARPARAVPGQPPAIDRDSCIASAGAQQHADWRHACPPVRYASRAMPIRRQGS
jgi:hypothetical protein